MKHIIDLIRKNGYKVTVKKNPDRKNMFIINIIIKDSEYYNLKKNNILLLFYCNTKKPIPKLLEAINSIYNHEKSLEPSF